MFAVAVAAMLLWWVHSSANGCMLLFLCSCWIGYLDNGCQCCGCPFAVDTANSLSMDDRFVAVLSLDFIHNKSTADLKQKMGFSCGCAATGKGQLSNKWLAVVVAVPLL